MEYAPLFLTIKTAVVATVVTFFLGIGLALAVARMRRFQGLADAVITLPLVLPPTVVGFSCCWPSAAAAPSASFSCSSM